MQSVPLAKLGPVQILDLEKSAGGIKYYDEYARICTVIKGLLPITNNYGLLVFVRRIK